MPKVAEPIIGVVGGERDRARLEHVALELAAGIPGVNLACTHEVAEAGGHYGATLRLARPLDAEAAGRLDRELARRGYGAVMLDGESHATLGDPGHAPAARALAELLARGEDGRAIEFEGRAGVPAVVTVEELIRTTAIDDVVALGAEITRESAIATDDFLRPRFGAGRLVLHVTALADGRFRPFEVPSPHQCCAHDH